MPNPPHGYRNLPPDVPLGRPASFRAGVPCDERYCERYEGRDCPLIGGCVLFRRDLSEGLLQQRPFHKRFLNAFWLLRDIGISRWESLRGAWQVARAK